MIFPSLERLSLREKIGQTCQIHGGDLEGAEGDKLAAFFQANPVGSIFLGSEIIGSKSMAAGQLAQLIGACQRVSRVPLSVAGDLENGTGGAVHGMTAFPNMLALGAVDSTEAAFDYGRLTAQEAVRIGFNWTFGPVVDLCLNWLNPVVSIRSLGQTPDRVAELAAAFIRGAQGHGLSATAKHFPGDGVDFRDQHLCVAINALGEEEWDATFGQVYRRCLEAGVHAVMAGHVALPWMEAGTGTGLAPLPATTSRRILTNLLRERLGFEGVVVSDALIMAGFRGKASTREDLIVEAFNAGVDVMLWPGADYFDIMERAIERRRISMARLDESVCRILRMKGRQGLLPGDGAVEDIRPETAPEVSTIQPLPEAARFADQLAERSLTLVENRRGLLPLNAAKMERVQILLATPREAGAEKRLAPLLKAIKARGLEVDLHVNGNCLDLRKKESAGAHSHALIAIFELWTHGMKNTMRPAGAMAECLWSIQGLEMMEPIIISLGSPYLIYDTPWADTYINAYSPNAHTLRAIEKALFGEVPFAGVSPVVIDAPWTVSIGRSTPQSWDVVPA